jgi:multiple sugar transport system permease protein
VAHKINVAKVTRRTIGILALAIIAIPFVFPFWWMFTSALKSPSEVFGALTLWPKTAHWENFREIFTYQPFGRHYLNSIVITAVVTVVTVLLSSISGYAFARVKFPGRSILFMILLSSMMMPAEVTIIPNFFIMKGFNLTNSSVPVVLLGIFGAQGAFCAFMMRQFFLTIPKELEEAACIDGLSRWGIFRKIMLPLAGPAVSAASILTMLNAWNMFLEPLVLLDDLNKFTLSLSLNNFRDAYGAPVWQLQMAATTLSVLPILIYYICAQRKITDAMAFSGLKG